MQRNREETEKKLIAAVGRIISKEGFGSVGINAVAREAGIDKVLIYRYFGGLDKLLSAYAESHSFWPTVEQLLGGINEEAGAPGKEEAGIRVLLNHYRFLRDNPVVQDIMRWELLEKNRLSDKLAEVREQEGLKLIDAVLPAADRESDFAAVAALIHAGLTYLVLRSKTAGEYLGINLDTPEGREQIENAVSVLVRAYFSDKKQD